MIITPATPTRKNVSSQYIICQVQHIWEKYCLVVLYYVLSSAYDYVKNCSLKLVLQWLYYLFGFSVHVIQVQSSARWDLHLTQRMHLNKKEKIAHTIKVMIKVGFLSPSIFVKLQWVLFHDLLSISIRII